MALGADEESPVLPVGIGGVYLHLPGIEYCQQIRNGQRSTQMTKAQMTQGLEGFDPDLCGKDSGLLLTSKFHNAHLQKSKKPVETFVTYQYSTNPPGFTTIRFEKISRSGLWKKGSLPNPAFRTRQTAPLK